VIKSAHVRAPGPALDADDHKELDGLMARLERKLKERGLGDSAPTRRRVAG
jgi:4-hydroxy-tetrahydrodipicolinate synthase